MATNPDVMSDEIRTPADRSMFRFKLEGGSKDLKAGEPRRITEDENESKSQMERDGSQTIGIAKCKSSLHAFRRRNFCGNRRALASYGADFEFAAEFFHALAHVFQAVAVLAALDSRNASAVVGDGQR